MERKRGPCRTTTLFHAEVGTVARELAAKYDSTASAAILSTVTRKFGDV